MGINFLLDLSKCLLYKKTGIPCITCGFTRAATSFFNGQFVESIKYNAGFIPFFITSLLIVCAFIFKNETIKKNIHYFVYSTLIILFVQWIFKIYVLFNQIN